MQIEEVHESEYGPVAALVEPLVRRADDRISVPAVGNRKTFALRLNEEDLAGVQGKRLELERAGIVIEAFIETELSTYS
jgi:hypothetical protein